MSQEYNNKVIKLFINFMNDIIRVFPEQKSNIYDIYQFELVNDKYDIDSSKLKNVCNRLVDNYDLICSKNEDVYSKDIIDNVDLGKMWKSDISDTTKNAMWNYVISLLLVYLSYSISKELNCPLSQIKGKKLTNSQLEKIKKIKKLSSMLNKKNIVNDGALNKIFDMTKTFQNTNIGNIAKNITEDLDITSLIGDNKDPMSLLNDPSKFMNVFNGLDKKIESQVKNGNYKKEDLLKEATDICGMMKGNQYFDNIMQQCNGSFGATGSSKGNQRTAKKVKPVGKNNQNKRTKVKVKKVNNN